MGNPIRVVLDTNVIVSALVYGGKPREITDLILDKKLQGFISPTLVAELIDVVTKKFRFNDFRIIQTEEMVREAFNVVHPRVHLHVLKDEPDNRILEAAVGGNCDYIVTGDKALLVLGSFKSKKIVPPAQFLETILEKE